MRYRTTTSLRLSLEMYNALKKIAEEDDRTLGWHIRKAIEGYIKRREWSKSGNNPTEFHRD